MADPLAIAQLWAGVACRHAVVSGGWHRTFAYGAALERHAGKALLWTAAAAGPRMRLWHRTAGLVAADAQGPAYYGGSASLVPGRLDDAGFWSQCRALFEEIFFRGFLLPAFLNAFRWLSLRGDLSPAAVEWLGVPPVGCVHKPTLCLAALATGIACVGAGSADRDRVAGWLCLVRLRLNSLASSTVVHAAYNFTLFAGILVQTGGFRHLDRLVH